MAEVRVAIIGVGNCANALLQGITYYRGLNDVETPGLVRPSVGPYSVSDIKIVAAFDVVDMKVGNDITAAALAPPNDTILFASMPYCNVEVKRGPTLDGLGKYLRERVKESDKELVDVTAELVNTGVDVVLNYLPVGSEKATRYYAQCAMDAGCAFVNCMPTFLASNDEWARKFREARLPIIGDDIKSQVGATIVHRTLATLFRQRGVRLDRTLQLNIGGNSDFLNMLERDRLKTKKQSKTQAVTSIAGVDLPADNVHVGPSDHVAWLTDRKWAHIRLEGTGFGGTPLNIELKLEVWDSPNSAGIVIDALRCAKLAMDRNLSGPVIAPSAAFMKSPPQQFDDTVAFDALEEFLKHA